MNKPFSFVLILTLVLVVVAAGFSLIASRFIDFGGVPMTAAQVEAAASQKASAALPPAAPAAGAGNASEIAVTYNPPKPEDAPEEIRAAVLYGRDLLMDTPNQAPDYSGNSLSCTNCHFEAGLTSGGENGGISLVGVWAKYPMYRTRTDYATDLQVRTNECFTRSINGKPLPFDSKEMQAILAYFGWISKGVPVLEPVPWLGLKPIENSHTPDPAAGKEVYATSCAACHGQNGEGTPAFPPLWGDHSYNDGAGMSRPATLATFTLHNMPKGNPTLTEEQALDVAEFVDTQPRPKFQKP